MGATWTMRGRSLMLSAILTPDLFVPIDSLAVALTRSVPVANAAASQLIEPNTGGYARAEYQAAGAYWAPTGFGEYLNTQTLTFPEITSSWGLISGWAIVLPGSGECLAVGSVMDPFVGEIGMVPTIAPGVLRLGNYD